MRYQYKNGEKLTRFSIRKYHFGAASVAVASLIFFGGGMSAKAENIPTSENAQVTGKSADSSSSGDKNSKIDDKSTSAQDKSAIVEKTADVVATVKVDKAELKKLIISLDTLFRSTEKDKIASIYDEVGQSISEAKLVLDKDTASAEEVNTQVAKLTEITKKLKEAVVKADKTTEKVKEESRQVDEKKSVDNKVNIFGETDKNSESGVSEKKESENQKSTAPDKGKLETLAKSIDVYLKSANEITRPETKELLKGVEETVLAVKKGLENPQLTTSEVEGLLKQGKEAEKKLALAVARENSGKRDSDNGKRMLPDSYFRAATYYRAAVGKVYDSHGVENLTEATVGYITKANDGSGYPPGTILYISHNDNGSVAGNNNNNLGPQPVKYLKNKVRAVVTKNSNGYHWKITYNEAREGRQNPIYYFTLPSGHSVTRMTLSENGAVVKQGGVREVFNGATDKYLTAVGSPNSGVNGGSYYENVANVNNGIVGDRGGVYTLDDFVKNDTNVYYNRDGMSNEDIRIMDKLYDKIKSSTQNVFAFRPRDYATGTTPGNKYEVEFDTVGDTEAPLYYIAGMKSFEVVPSGRYMHKSYQQWYGIQERYNITVDTTRLSTTFLKGTGAGDVETKKGLQSSAVTIEDTYTNNRFNPGRGDIGEYHTFKPTGNFGADFIKGNHNRFVRDFTGGEDGINMTADRTRGNHTLYIEAVIRGEKINFRLPYKIVTQSDIYQPLSKTVNDVKNYKENLGEASNYITEYRYNSVPGFRVPDHEDMTIGKPFKDRISDFPTSSARIKEQAVKSVEWAGGSNDLTTGARVIELTINGKKELFTVPSDIDVAPGRTISAENVKKLNDAIHEAYKKIDTNGHEVDAAKVPKISSTTPVWVKKQIKVTYYDNENNARTNNQDDSVDYVDVLFKNIRKETAPTTPTVSTPADGTVSVTPNGTTDKLVVSYRPTNQNSDTTITVKKSGTTWGTLDTLPNGVTVNSANGVVSIAEPTVKDESTVTAKATYLNSDEASATGVAKNPDNVAPTVTLNGTTLTDNASNKTVHVFRGSLLELPLKYYDNAATGRVNISYKNDDGLPQGVWFNDNANASSNYTIKQNGKTVNSQGSYTVRGNVSNTARLGERPITLKVSDSADGNVDSGNKKEVKFNVRTYDIEPNSTKVTVEKGTTLSAQDAKAAVTKVNGALDLPEGTTYEWVDTNGRNQTFTPNTAGVQNYRVKVTLPSSETGNNAAFRSSKIVNVSVNVRPEAPTVTSTTATNTTTENIILSTDKTLTGSGIAGAKIKVVVNNKVLKEATVEQNGKWSVTLDKGFNSNYVSDLGQFPDPDIVKVTQSVAGVESSENNVKIVLGESKIHPSEKTGSSVFAGAKKLTVEVPHDAGMFYVKYKYREKTNASEQDSAIMRELGFKRETIDGPWIPINPEYGVVTETPVKGKFTTTVTIDMKENIKESTKDSEKVAAIANIKYRGYSSPSGWKATPVTNEKPTLVANYTGNKQVVEFGSTLDPKTLVRASDKEDDKQLTRGNGTQVEVISVNGNTGVKTVNTNETGTYTVKLKATDSQGKQSDEITVTAEVTKNHQAVAKPVINLIQGESLSDADKRSLIELTKGNGKEALPSDARVEVTLATDSPGDKTAAAKVTFKDGTVRNVDVRYKVHKTFETVTKVYDFAGVGRNDSPASYYLNPGGLPDGMSWVFKKGNGTVGTADNNKLKESLNADGIGSTTYNFGAKYPRGRFTDSPSEAEKLSYTPTFTHEVFDVEANNDSRTQKNRVEVNNGEKLSAAQAASAVVKTSNSPALPAGTTYEWVKSATDATALTDAEKNVTEFGEITRYVKVTLPKVSETGPNANQVQPYKIIPVTLKVNETVKPTVQMDGRRLTTNAEDNKFVIFRGATFNPTFTVNDNSGKISTMEVSGLPSGTNFIKNTETANGDVQLSGNVTTTANATLGTNNVGSVKVTDARGNTETYKFKYVVVDVEVKNTPETVNKGTKLFVPGKAGESKDSHNYVKAVVSPNTDGSDVYYPGGMNFKWSKNNAEITSETVFNTPGTITYNAVVKFPNNKSDKNDVDIDGDGRNENVTIYAPDKIEKTVTFKVKPTAPTVTPKDNGDVLITPTNETNVDKVSVTFTKQDDSTEVTYTAKKNASGVWEFGSGAPLTVDSTTGVFRLKDRVVKDGSTVTAKALTTDGTGSVQSNPATGIAGNGDAVLPEIEFKNTVIDSTGDRVVYITPTEDTNIDVATITDNSNKLLEAVFFDNSTNLTDLGNYGLTYNKVTRNGDTITNAPYTLTVTGTLNKFKSGSTLWNDGEVITTRYASAMDAAENNIKDKPGSRSENPSNPYRVVFKVLTQATKYTPTANALTRTDQQAKHTNDQVLGAVSGTNIAAKEIVGNIPNESGVAVVKVTYNDGSSENVNVPINVTPTDATLIDPKVTPVVRDDQHKPNKDDVAAAVTLPEGTTGKTITKKEVVGDVPTAVGGPTNVVVKVTYGDGSTENVDVPVTITKSDATLIDPKVTPVVRDDQHKPNKDDVAAAVTLPEGTTGKTITKKEVVGDVPTAVGGPTNVVVKVTYGDGSTENVDVPVTITKSDATLIDPKVTPVVRDDQHKPNKDDVAAAVTLPEGTTGKTITKKEVVGDVPTAVGGPTNVVVKVTYGDGSTENVDVPVTITKSDATLIDPKVTPVVRDDQHKPNKDDVAAAVTLPEGTTGKTITKKEVVGDVPTAVGGPTNVVVKVTYGDGSTENVDVPVTITKSDATLIDPKVTPVVRDDQHKPNKDDVAAAVTLPEGTTGKTITKKEVVGDVPTAVGGPTNVVVKVTYGDGSTENVDVPVTITKSDATLIDPKVTPVVRDDQHKPNKDDVAAAVTLPEGTTGKTITKKEVVGDVPTAVGGPTNVVVKVTYGDGSTENVDVPVTITKSDATLIDPKVTPVVRDDQHKPNKDDVAAAVTLPEGTTGKTITKKEVVGDVPTAVGGPTNVVVKVTYGDGSTENVDVPVTITKSDATLIDPKVTPVVRDDQHKPNKDDVAAAVTLPEGTTGKTITKKEVVGDVPTAVGGPTNVVVKVTYGDGSTENVDVPVTITKSDATLIDPKVTPVVRDDQHKPNKDDVAAAVTLPEGTTGKTITKKEVVGDVPTAVGGPTNVVVKVTYGDGSTENVDVPVTITKSDATLIDPKVTPVVRDDQHKPNKDDVAAAVTLPEGTTGKTITKKEVVGDVPTAVGGPTNVVVKVTYGDGSTENVDVPVTITKSDATLIDPKVTPVVRDDQHKPNKDDVAAAVTLPEGTTGKTITKKEVVGDVPTAVGGPTNVVVKVTYGDGSTENVDVPVTITKSDATLIDPKVTPVVRDDQHKPNKDDVAAAVTLPEGTTGKTITKKEVVGDVPTAVGGPTNVVVKVTYGDGSTENVDVPVTITKSDATLIDPKVTPVVRDDQHKPNKDDVAAAVTLPEGTTGKTITKKEVVGDVPTAVGGPTNVVVKVTYGDGSTENVDVPVTITKSDATLIDPKVTPVVRDDQHKPNKDDVAAAVTLPEGTTGKTITKKEVVGDVPTAVGGPTNVVVKVTYGDGSTENVDVPVTITKSDATLIDPKVTPVVRDDQHKPNKDDVAAAVTLPEGTTGKTITKKEVVGDVPTAVGGPTNVVVKVTYGDGSTENVDVPVTITKSDATLIDPKVTPVVRDDQHKPNKDDVAAAVTLPEGTTGKTITKKEVVGDVPTAVGGPTNVVVKVTYGDGSTENVDVPVTITKSDATLIDPKVTPVVRDDQHKPNKDDVAAAVTLPEGTTGKTITKKEVVGDVPTAVGGPTNVVVKVTYGDGSTENVDVPVTITKSDATLIDPKVTPVVRDDQHKPNKDDVAAAVTLPEGTTGKTITKKEVVGDVPTAVGGPTNVVVKVTYGDGSTENVDVPVTITKSDATLIDPKVTPVVRDDQHKPNKDDVAAAVTLPEGTTGKTITKKEVVGDVPTAVGGPTNVVVKVTYGDGSTENVDVPVTITKSDATLIDPKVTPVVRDDQHKPNKDDVAAAVTLPEGTTGKTITKKEVVGDVPTAVGGPTNVVVKVTYGDGSTENVDVPVTITKSDATLIDPKVTPVVRDDQHKPNKDDVAAAVTLPEGTTGKTITKKEVVGDVPTAVGGPTNVVVKVTYGDGSTENVDVPVTITKSDATLIDPKVTPVVRDDQHKPNKDDVAAAVTLPEGTTGKTITKKEVVGDVPTAVGGPTNVVVKVTYGDGSTENVDVPVTITKSDATLIDPKVTPVVRDDQHKPNKDDVAAAVTLPEGTTGKTITKKEVVGDVPTAVGGPTNVVVKVTYGDGSTENVDVPVLVVGLPSKTPVKNASNLTPDEKEKVKAKVLEKNPGKEVTVGDDGTATVKDPTTGISHTIPGTDLVNQDFEPVKPTEKVPVKDKAHLTPEEKKQVADKVKDKNPGKKVTVGDDGTATVTDPTTGISHTIPGTDLVNQDFELVKPTEKVPVKDKAHLTPEEKKQVEDKVKDKNPGKEVTVGDDGTATVTDPTTGISHTIPGTDLVNQDFEPVKPTEKVPVKDKAHLTPDEKEKVKAKVLEKNPGKEVTVGDDGAATVKDPTTGISHTIPGTDLVNQDFELVKPTEKVPVKDKAHLTPEEKKQVADKVKDKNPGKKVTVGDDGTATVTDPTTGISHTIPGTDLVNQDFEPVKPTEKVPVKDKAHLTPDEKEKVKAKVLEKNPGKEVTVGDDGAATVKDPTTGISHIIPGTDLVNQDFEPVKPTEKVPVKDKAHLTPEEKKQVEDKVKDKNPGKEVTVGDDGTATVTDPTTGISHTIPGTDLVNQDFEPVKPTEKVAVKDKAHLTPEEKKQVEDKVKDKNPGKEVTVGDDGTATVTDPTTGISHTIPGTDLVNQDFEPVIPADKIPVKDPVNLTQEEQDKVKESVEKANPGKKVIVDKTGKVTIIDPNTNISHEIPGEKLITLDPPVFELPEYTAPIGTTGVDENGNLIAPPIMAQTKLIITKWTDEDGKELKAPDAKAPKVLGEANEALEAGKIEGYEFVRTETKDDVVTHIFRKVTSTKPTKPADNGEEQGGDNKPQPTPTAKVETSTKRLANTGEAETNTGLAGLGLAILGSLLAVAKRRKKDEE